eukprot:scaffold15799_cov28-Tisochrysis_lutea.AAC.4
MSGQPMHGSVLALHEQRASPRLRAELVKHGCSACNDKRVRCAHDKVGTTQPVDLVGGRGEDLGIVGKRDVCDRAGVELLEPCDHAQVVSEDAHLQRAELCRSSPLTSSSMRAEWAKDRDPASQWEPRCGRGPEPRRARDRQRHCEHACAASDSHGPLRRPSRGGCQLQWHTGWRPSEA